MNQVYEAAPQLVALDWGTSSLRAYLMRVGEVIESRSSERGIQNLPAPGVTGYEQAFAEIAGDWVGRWDLPVVASGMVGSVQGWREAPYVRCPADIQTLASHCVRVPSGIGASRDVIIAPGVLFDQPDKLPDVMRGEEIQIAGALSIDPKWAERCCIVLPGTHSKWVVVENGSIVRYTTYLTGELYAVLRKHSILGRLMTETSERLDPDAFALGLAMANAQDTHPGDLLSQIFGARTLGLTGRLPHASLADYLSGVLIGHELISGLAHTAGTMTSPLILIGEPALSERYVRSLQYLGRSADAVLGNTAPVGLWNLAKAGGWI